MKVSKQVKLCEPVHLLTFIKVKSLHSSEPSDFTIDNYQALNVSKICISEIKNRLANKVFIRDTVLDKADHDTLYLELARTIRTFYHKKVKNYMVNVDHLNHVKGYILALLVDDEIMDDNYRRNSVVKGLHYLHYPPRNTSMAHLFLLDTKSGELIFYKYDFRQFDYATYEPNSVDDKTIFYTEQFEHTWRKIIDRDINCLIRKNMCR